MSSLDETMFMKWTAEMIKGKEEHRGLFSHIEEGDATLSDVLHEGYFMSASLHRDADRYIPVTERSWCTMTTQECIDMEYIDREYQEADMSDVFFAHYSFVKEIGKTKTSRVYEVSSDGVSYAAKTIERPYGNATPHEVEIMRHLEGVEGVVQLKDTYDLGSGRIGVLDPVPSVAIVMEMPTGNVSTYHCVKAHKTDEQKRRILSRLVKILSRIDERNIAHNDLHENNFLVSGPDDRVTLIDFGRAQYKHVPFEHVNLYKNLRHSPPELVEKGLFEYDRFTMWNVGLLIANSFERDLIPLTARDLLSRLFAPPEKRPTISQFFNHPYFM
jgi:serine/threonine protein kinase